MTAADMKIEEVKGREEACHCWCEL